MGRALDAELFELAYWDDNPVSDAEFESLEDSDFTVPIDELKITESKYFTIPGLWTPNVAVKEKYLSQINMFTVNMTFLNHAVFEVNKTCYVVSGRTRALDLAAMVHSRLELGPLAEIVFSIQGVVLSPGDMLLKFYPKNMSLDSFLELECTYDDALLPDIDGNDSSDDDDDAAADDNLILEHKIEGEESSDSGNDDDVLTFKLKTAGVESTDGAVDLSGCRSDAAAFVLSGIGV